MEDEARVKRKEWLEGPSVSFCLFKGNGQIVWMSDNIYHWLQDGHGRRNLAFQNLVRRFVSKAQSNNKLRGSSHENFLVCDLMGKFRIWMWSLPVHLRGEKTPCLIAMVLIPTYETLLAEVAHCFCLSEREVIVLHGIADGLSPKQIAAHLHLSRPTVQTYRMRLMHKLKLSNPMDITSWLLKMFLSAANKTDPSRSHRGCVVALPL